MKLRAFTLAEVLITLVVIGVVAAITVPSITVGTRKTEYTARLKKFYSTLCQAQMKASAIGQSWDIWCEDAGNAFDTTTKTTEAFARDYLLPYISANKHGIENGKYTIHMADGTAFYLTKEQCLHFFYDVNGDKKPNVSGRDQYRFTYCPASINKSIIDAQPGVLVAYFWATGKTREQAIRACKSNPDTCSKLLLMDQWTYKDDYPYAI